MNSMRTFVYILLVCVLGISFSCTRPAPRKVNNDPFPVKYENDLFSIKMPKGWEYDDSGWKGLDSMQNEVDFYSEKSPVWFHVVKAFMPIQWKNIDEATEMAITARTFLTTDDVRLMNRVDSIFVGGYPASILYFANFVDNDTIIQKQFVTYLQDSHIVVYFNENFYLNDWDIAQEIGDDIICNVKLKKVKNPLESDSIIKQRVDNAIDNNKIDKKYMDRAKQVLDELNSK